jgi:hypothetical protein
VVECGGLENRCSPSGEPGVRIPLSPQSLNKPRVSGVVYFNDVPKKACFMKEQSENKQKPLGFIQVLQGSPEMITAGNPHLWDRRRQ